MLIFSGKGWKMEKFSILKFSKVKKASEYNIVALLILRHVMEYHLS